MRTEIFSRTDYCELKKEITNVITRINVGGRIAKGKRSNQKANRFIVRMKAQTKPEIETAIHALTKNGYSVNRINTPRRRQYKGQVFFEVKCIVITPPDPGKTDSFPEMETKDGKNGRKK